ncbi:lariat debranching enzyme, C-terminal domain-containing protein [Aspergillus ambiguus]|uniref:RNA lariat debranching enzyme n=1 Tax=Aspergillus ambiguus TaxID=176160 RepID=UPI003CCCADF3
MEDSKPGSIRVALEGCGHGCLNDIYASVEKAASLKGWDGVDLLIIGGDFQAVRNSNDMACMSVPNKYKELGDFHEYYSGQRTAPYLTIFIGGNHEAGNHLFELYYGGWVAPNIYYMGAANVLRCGPLRIAGMSGIWKGYDYRKPHFERLPYNRDDVQSIYHVRELDVRKLLQIRTQVDLGLSHDWPKQVEYSGDHEALFRVKRGFRQDSHDGKLGNVAAKYVLDRLRPAYWFSAHLHVKFAASIAHGEYRPCGRPVSNPGEIASQGSHPQGRQVSFGMDGAVASTLKEIFDETQEVLPRADAASAQSEQATAVQEDNVETPTKALLPDDNETLQDKLSAWNNFHAVAAQNEASSQNLPQNDAAITNIKHNLTWRKVEVDMDGAGRKLTGAEYNGEGRDRKKQKTQESQSVKNADEIDLDLDSDSDHDVPTKSAPGPASKNIPPPAPAAPSTTQPSQRIPTDVSEELRNQLPASFSRPKPEPEPINGPLPDTISNNRTDFLALDKCLPNRDFLQLVEFHTISEHEEAQCQRPYRLQYDKEWLAITRVFAPDLQLGDPSARPPADKGDIAYKPLIEAEEDWVEENVVKPGKMTVPENFTPTAPFYDPAIPITTDQMPPEYTNPQTAQFCELLNIENKFHLSDEERQSRMNSGPREARPQHPRRGFGPGRGGGGRGSRGRGRGRGRR